LVFTSPKTSFKADVSQYS